MESAISLHPTGAALLAPPPNGGPPAQPLQSPPFIGDASARRQRRGLIATFLTLSLLFCLALVLVAVSALSFLWLDSDARALRNSVMASVPGDWQKGFALNVGGGTLGLARLATAFVHMPPEPRAALQALRGGEVGIYHLREPSSPANYAEAFVAADKSMSRRGWTRIVGVAQGAQFVAVYLRNDLRTPKIVECSVAVLNDGDLVVVSARGNVEELLPLAMENFKKTGLGRQINVRHEPVAGP